MPQLRLSADSQRHLDVVLEDAERDATDARQPRSVRCDALDLLAVADGDAELFVRLALDDLDQAVRLRAIASARQEFGKLIVGLKF